MVSPPTGLNQQGGSDKTVRFLRISSYLGPKYQLSHRLRQTFEIKGINLLGKEVKISQFADYTNLFSADITSEEHALNSRFWAISGLKLNVKKTNAIWLGKWSTNKNQAITIRMGNQGAKKVVSDSPGLVDFAIGLVNSVLNLPDGQAKIFRRIKITKVLLDKCFKFVINSCRPKVAATKWNLHKQDEVSDYMSDGAL